MAHGAWHMAHGAWRMAHGTWRMAHGGQFPVLSAQFPVGRSSFLSLMDRTRNTVHSTQWRVSLGERLIVHSS